MIKRILFLFAQALVLFMAARGLPAYAASGDAVWLEGTKPAFSQPLAGKRSPGIRSNWAWTDGGEATWDFGLGLDMCVWRVSGQDAAQTVSGRWGINSRFQYNSESFDLWSADFLGGIAWGRRVGRNAFEAFIYHESSHLGDEILDRREKERRDIQFNGIRCLVARQWTDGFRVYAGGSYQPLADPSKLQSFGFHLGSELTELPPYERGYLALDTEWWEWRSMNPDVKLQAGVVLGFPREQAWITPRAYVQFYTGHVLLGQFFDDTETHIAFGLGGTF